MPDKTIIRTNRLILEPIETSHAAHMLRGLQDRRGYSFMPAKPPESLASLEARYAKLSAGQSADGELWLNWMARLQEPAEFVGYVQATIDPKKQIADIAYHIFPALWGRGFGVEATRAMLETIQTQYSVKEARAYIDTRNMASIKLVETLEFERIEFLKDADFFNGATSDEFCYRLKLDS